MVVKRCPACKTDNPAIYTRCLNCGALLPQIPENRGSRRYLVPLVTLLVVAIVLILVIVPAIEYSMESVHELSNALNVTPTPVPEYHIGQPVREGDLQVMVATTRLGEKQLTGTEFYSVTVAFRNYNATDFYTIAATDLSLNDGHGNYYSPLSIQSKTSVDLPPNSSGISDVLFIIPQNSGDLRLVYSFPSTIAASAMGRNQVAFSL